MYQAFLAPAVPVYAGIIEGATVEFGPKLRSAGGDFVGRVTAM